MLSWNEAEAEGTSKIGNQEYQDKDATPIFETVIQEDTSQNRNGNDEPVGDLDVAYKFSSGAFLQCRGQMELTCMRVVTKVEYPKPLIMMVPKFEMPPLGTLPVKT